jgi:hypothetical protein
MQKAVQTESKAREKIPEEEECRRTLPCKWKPSALIVKVLR